MTGLAVCQKRILAVRWVMGKHWQFNFLKADLYPGALMEMAVVFCYFCAYVSGWRASFSLGWNVGVPGGMLQSVGAVHCHWRLLWGWIWRQADSYFCCSSSAPRLLGTQTGIGLVIVTFMSQMKWWKSWHDFFIIFWWMEPGSSDLPRVIYGPKRAPMGVHTTVTDLQPKYFHKPDERGVVSPAHLTSFFICR